MTKIKIKNLINTESERGQILVISSVFFAIMLSMVSVFLVYVTQGVRQERQLTANAQAIRLAEAGIDEAVYQLNQSGSYSGETNTQLTTGVFTVTVTSINSSSKRVTSTGYVPNSTSPTATKTVQATVDINSSTVSFNYGVQVGAGGLSMNNGSQVTGNIFSDGNISGSGTITGDAIVAGGTQPTADQQWTTQNSGFNLGDTSAHADLAMAFTPSTTSTLNKVTLYLKKVGSPSDLTINILADNSGVPSKNVLASGTLAASTVTGSYSFLESGFSSLPSLTSGTKYWILAATASVSSSNYFIWGDDTGNGYSGGSGYFSSNWDASHPSWTAAGADLDFQTYMGGVNTSISGVSIGGNGTANTLSGCTITKDAYYQTLSGCAVGGTLHPNTADTAPQPFAISNAQISSWESTAAAGGVIAGPYTLSGSTSLGPKEINGDLTVNGTLTLTGPVWVNGNITFSNGSGLTVSASLGNNGAIVIADAIGNTANSGVVTLSNNMTVSGNGNPDSFPMVISTNSSNNAMSLNNNATGIILFASAGTINVSNNAGATELTGYAIKMGNNSTITYNNGLQSASFSNGPGGSWVYLTGTYAITK